MATVNLMPDHMKLNEQRKKRLRVWCVVIILFVLSALTWSGIKYLSYISAEQNAQKVVRQTEAYQTKIQSLTQIKAQQDLWKDRYQLLEHLENYPNIQHVMTFLAQQTPELVYLESMKFSPNLTSGSVSVTNSLPKAAQMFQVKSPPQPSSKPTPQIQPVNSSLQLYLTGQALYYHTIADYITVLRRSNKFSVVQLKHIGRNRYQNAKTVEFQIICTLAPKGNKVETYHASVSQTQNF